MKSSHFRYLIPSFIILLTLTSSISAAFLPWPIDPDSSAHVVSFFYGGWQAMWRAELFRNVNYFHTGIDIPGDTAETVYAVESGYVKAILTIFDSDNHWRIIIADSSGTGTCEGWLYAHIARESIPFSVGDYVNAGESLGILITWPYPDTPVHLHFSRIRYAGIPAVWAAGFWNYEFTENPLNNIGPAGDTEPPFLTNAWDDQLLAICANQSSNYFEAGETISGDVDILCSAYDYCGYHQYRTCPYKLEYKIDGDSSLPWTVSFNFGGSLDSYDGEMEALSHMVYKYDTYCNTTFSDSLISFYILTNTDGDDILEIEDTTGCWSTTGFHNGEYMISVRVSDFDGNIVIDSMPVSIGNYFNLSGHVTLEGVDPNLQGTHISVLPDDLTTSTVYGGGYAVTEVGGGYQTVSFSRPGYETLDTLLLFNQNHQVDVTLTLIDYVCGDANQDSQANVADAVYLINYVFKGSQPPAPVEAGDANCDGEVNVGDAVYMINYVFRSGPPPCCP